MIREDYNALVKEYATETLKYDIDKLVEKKWGTLIVTVKVQGGKLVSVENTIAKKRLSIDICGE